ncbi:MAG: ATP-dependent DNA helicase RecQ [Lacibacter sp.]
MQANIHHILQHYWGYNRFRPLQEEIITSVLQGVDTLALLPTGGGKSICYQVPAMVLPGLCLVVSPLIALMNDQVAALRRKSITAFALTSERSRRETEQILHIAANSNCKFLYVAPERLGTRLFQEYLPALGVSLLAVDEAHCISQWGYDFRPSYLRIAELRQELPNVPVLAVTASATPDVQQDICEKLHMRQPAVFRGSFVRPNLSFSVFEVPSKINKIQQVLQNVPGPALVYCRSRRQTVEVARLLQLQGIAADCYHAGLSAEERNRRQEAWLRNRLRVMVCTNAFGMGIDKADVRVVLHHDVPDCLENYYQEAGRAGRDGARAYAVLLYDSKELATLQLLPQQRYPEVEAVQHVYRCLVNYLQVPAGSGEDQYYPFDFDTFTHRFGLSVPTAAYALQVLEQEGWLRYSSHVALPHRLQFVCSRETLEAFEAAHPGLEPLIKALLRTYGGIWDVETMVSPWQLARLLGVDKASIPPQLQQLHRYGIIRYRPATDAPKVQFLTNRPAAADLPLPPGRMEQRRQQLARRIEQMRQFVQQQAECRQVLLARYFGDTAVQPCGICDVCLFRTKTNISAEDYMHIRKQLVAAARNGKVLLQPLLDGTGTRRRQKMLQVVQQLVAEEKARLLADGNLELLA